MKRDDDCFLDFSRKKIWNLVNYEDLNGGHLCLEVWKRSGSPRPDRIAAVFASRGGEEKMVGEHLSSKLSGARPESGFRWGRKTATFLWWFWLRFIEVISYFPLLRLFAPWSFKPHLVAYYSTCVAACMLLNCVISLRDLVSISISAVLFWFIGWRVFFGKPVINTSFFSCYWSV